MNIFRRVKKLVWRNTSLKNPKKEEEFIFVYSTGRCGTHHLAKVFSGDDVYATHEEEHIDTDKAIENYLWPISESNDQNAARKYVDEYKKPHMIGRLRSNNKKIFFDSGHQIIFGITGEILRQLDGHVKFIRLRRNRLQTALSFLSTPEYHDPWMPHWQEQGKVVINGKRARWALCPSHDIVTIKPTSDQWSLLNRYQRYLWYVDEVERQWEEFTKEHSFPYIEVELCNLSKKGYKKINQFTSMKVDKKEVEKKHDSTEDKKYEKPNYNIEIMKDMDNIYKKIIEKNLGTSGY